MDAREKNRFPRAPVTSARFVVWAHVGISSQPWRVICETDDLNEAYKFYLESGSRAELWDRETKAHVEVHAW